MVTNLPAMQETQVQFLGWEYPLEKRMATQSSILVWKILWKEDPGSYSSWGHKDLDMTEQLKHRPHLTFDFSSVQSLSHVWLFGTPWTARHHVSLSIIKSWSLPKLMSIESVMPSNYLILCHPLILLPSIYSSIRVFSNESALRIRGKSYKW